MLLVTLLVMSQAPMSSALHNPMTEGPIFGDGTTNQLAFFEFAPTSGAGMGAACACANVTSAQGGALTMTRASTATCSKQGAATTDINNGDLVTCGVNIPRVEAGTYLRESSRQNLILQSETLDSATWSKEGSTTAAVVTADFGTAPSGAVTADRVQLTATTGAAYSDIYQVFTTAAAGDSTTCSAYVKSNGAAGVSDLCVYNGTDWVCTACAYSGTTWSRCVLTRAGGAITTRFCKFGNNGLQNGGVSRNAADLLVWGFQGESPAAFASSYIPTTAAAVTRSADSALTGTVTATGTNFSMAGSVAFLSDGSGAPVIFQLGSGAPALASIGTSTNTAAAYTINATSTTPAVSAMGTSTWRASLNDSSGTRTAFWAGGSVAAPAASMVGTATAVSIGAVDARTSLVCLDPTPGRCQ